MQAVPFAVTALLPVVCFPTLGILDKEKTSSAYVNDAVFLFLGSFLMAAAIQRWNLHRRLAMRVILMVGTNPRRLLLVHRVRV
jgi:sodium-dependent dicarboxylate transporter 2/3/5